MLTAQPPVYCQPALSPALIWVFLAFNVSTDLYLISIPMPMLFRASMPARKKAALIGLFSCGLFVVMAATLRVALLVTDPVNGALLAGSWAVRETFVAVVVTNLPMLFPLFRRWLGPYVGSIGSSLGFGSSRRSRGGGGGSSRKLPTLETFGRGGRRFRKGPRSANPITDVTYTESEERIVEEMRMRDLSGGKATDGGNASGRGEGSDADASLKDREGAGGVGADNLPCGRGDSSSGHGFNFFPSADLSKHDIEKGLPRHPGVDPLRKTLRAKDSDGSMKSRSSIERPQPRMAGMVPKPLKRSSTGKSTAAAAIHKEVSISVEEYPRMDVDAKGNYTSTWANREEGELPSRSEYFVDHVHQEGYRNASP
jgi:hypothetical protein